MKKTEKEAHEMLRDLWFSGQVPSNFTDAHSQYYYAVQYIVKYGTFDYNLFTAWLVY